MLKIILGIALAVYFIGLVVIKTPASIVTAQLAKAVPQLQLATIRGTAWNGRAGSAVVNAAGITLPLGTLKWQFQPASLLAFRACVNVESDLLNGVLCRGLTGTNHFKNLQLDLPVELANRFTGAVKLEGIASMSIRQASVNDKGFVSALDGNVAWRGARLNVEGMWFTLGDFAADLSAASEGAVAASIFDLAGEFGVKLNGEVGVNVPPKVAGEIELREGVPDEIRDAMGLFAVQQDNGAYAISYPMGQ